MQKQTITNRGQVITKKDIMKKIRLYAIAGAVALSTVVSACSASPDEPSQDALTALYTQAYHDDAIKSKDNIRGTALFSSVKTATNDWGVKSLEKKQCKLLKKGEHDAPQAGFDCLVVITYEPPFEAVTTKRRHLILPVVDGKLTFFKEIF